MKKYIVLSSKCREDRFWFTSLYILEFIEADSEYWTGKSLLSGNVTTFPIRNIEEYVEFETDSFNELLENYFEEFL